MKSVDNMIIRGNLSLYDYLYMSNGTNDGTRLYGISPTANANTNGLTVMHMGDDLGDYSLGGQAFVFRFGNFSSTSLTSDIGSSSGNFFDAMSLKSTASSTLTTIYNAFNLNYITSAGLLKSDASGNITVDTTSYWNNGNKPTSGLGYGLVGGSRNYFGFNKGIATETTTASVVFDKTINGLTITTTAANGSIRIKNLGFDGTGGYFVVSFWIKSSVAGTVTVDLMDSSPYAGSSNIISSTTTYQKIELYYNSSTYVATPYFGFFDIAFSVIGTVNIKNLMIERGNVVSDYAGAYDDYLHLSGGTLTGDITSTKFITSGGTASQFVKGNGTLDSNTYLTSNQTITLTGGATGSGTTSIAVTLTNASVTGQALTGLSVATNSAIAATDSILVGLGKAQAHLTAIDNNWANYALVGHGHSNYVQGDNATRSTVLTSFDGVTFSTFASGQSATGSPVAGWHHLINVKYTGTTTNDWNFQIAAGFGTSATGAPPENYYMRIQEASSWKSWRKLWHDGNLNSDSVIVVNKLTSNTWPNSNPGYTSSGATDSFSFCSTGGVVNIYADGNFYATDSKYPVWHTGNHPTTLSGYGITDSLYRATLNGAALDFNSINSATPGAYNCFVPSGGTLTNNPNMSVAGGAGFLIQGYGAHSYWDTQLFLSSQSDTLQFRTAYDLSGTKTWRSWYTVWHNGNLTPASIGAAPSVAGGYLPLSGGAMSGSITFANGIWNVVGDDTAIGDINEGATLGLSGRTGGSGSYLRFCAYGQSNGVGAGTGVRIGYDGTQFRIEGNTYTTGTIKGVQRPEDDWGTTVYAMSTGSRSAISNGTNAVKINRWDYSGFVGYIGSNTAFFGMTQDHQNNTGGQLAIIAGGSGTSHIGFFAGLPTLLSSGTGSGCYQAPLVGIWNSSSLQVYTTLSGTSATFSGTVTGNSGSRLGSTIFYGNLDSQVIINDFANGIGWNRSAGAAEFVFINNLGPNTNSGGFRWYQVRSGIWDLTMNLDRYGNISSGNGTPNYVVANSAYDSLANIFNSKYIETTGTSNQVRILSQIEIPNDPNDWYKSASCRQSTFVTYSAKNNDSFFVSDCATIGGILNLEGSTPGSGSYSTFAKYMPKLQLFGSDAIWTSVGNDTSCASTSGGTYSIYFGSSRTGANAAFTGYNTYLNGTYDVKLYSVSGVLFVGSTFLSNTNPIYFGGNVSGSTPSVNTTGQNSYFYSNNTFIHSPGSINIGNGTGTSTVNISASYINIGQITTVQTTNMVLPINVVTQTNIGLSRTVNTCINSTPQVNRYWLPSSPVDGQIIEFFLCNIQSGGTVIIRSADVTYGLYLNAGAWATVTLTSDNLQFTSVGGYFRCVFSSSAGKWFIVRV